MPFRLWNEGKWIDGKWLFSEDIYKKKMGFALWLLSL